MLGVEGCRFRVVGLSVLGVLGFRIQGRVSCSVI